MSKKFYRELTVIRTCKSPGCGARYKPNKGTVSERLGFCDEHRAEYYRTWKKKYGDPWLKSLTPVRREAYKVRRYQAWLDWLKNKDNLKKRRAWALASYHRNKHKHREERNRKDRERYHRRKLNTQ